MALLEDLVSVLRRAADLAHDGGLDFTPRGAAIRDPSREPGWYRIDTRIGNTEVDRLDGAVLAPKEELKERRYALIASELADAAVWVRVQSRPGAPRPGCH
ncbi:hypothetical protein [Dactylosporangium sp. NPDC005555]|uniref:hypothetical protein n=1 Tax=Dactylosporangium sp. NPDC005555 TaxID=3154889 RepID=UPI0033B779C6